MNQLQSLEDASRSLQAWASDIAVRRERFLAYIGDLYDLHVERENAAPGAVIVMFNGLGHKPTVGDSVYGNEGGPEALLIGDVGIMSRALKQDALKRPHATWKA